ncbi:TonB family protein [Herbaspirillum sp. HC18]|nr:TonB family protein [Herbaspirillum sp. HC18]
MAQAVPTDVPADPVHVTLFRTQAVMHVAQSLADLVKQPGESLYGTVIVSIPIFQDGAIYEKDGGPVVERSSGIPMLDQAALNIVRQAAPYGAFPENMRSPDNDDVWVITSRFNFTKTDESGNEPTLGGDESKK